MAKNSVRQLHQVLRTLDTVMLTTIDEHYHLVARPMMIRVGDRFDGVLYLMAPRDSRVVSNIAARAAVNLSFNSADTAISIAGQANIVTDPYEVALSWHGDLAAWIPFGRSSAALIEITLFEGRSWKRPVEQGDHGQLSA